MLEAASVPLARTLVFQPQTHCGVAVRTVAPDRLDMCEGSDNKLHLAVDKMVTLGSLEYITTLLGIVYLIYRFRYLDA